MGLTAADMAAIQRRIDKAAAKIMNRVRLATTRIGVDAVDDSTDVQNVGISMLHGEARAKVERFQRYGFSSSPPVGTEGVVVAVGGNRDHLILVAEDARGVRITNLAPGESGQYGQAGQTVICKADGSIEVEPALAGKFKIGAAAVLAIARATDPLTSSAAMAAWALAAEGACNVAAPGTFTPANSFLTTLVPPGTFGTITSGGTKGAAE